MGGGLVEKQRSENGPLRVMVRDARRISAVHSSSRSMLAPESLFSHESLSVASVASVGFPAHRVLLVNEVASGTHQSFLLVPRIQPTRLSWALLLLNPLPALW